MARTLLIAGNWKLNLSVADGVALVQALAKAAVPKDREIVVFPTALGVYPAVQAAVGSRIQVGVQNAYFEQKGAFTGEISPELAKAAGATWVLLGHSERRQFFGETDAALNKKLGAVLAAGLKPMLCVGETLAERQGGKLEAVLKAQVAGALAGFKAEQLSSLVIAYEPVWAIGTGVVATTEQAQEAHVIVRRLLREQIGAAAEAVRILYGGSVKADNAKALLGQPDIDGALVGGASLKLDLFQPICVA